MALVSARITRLAPAALFVAAALVVGAVAPASTAAPAPPGAGPLTASAADRVSRLVPAATAPEGWAPQGTPVADSGFLPNPNGFAFENYGDRLPDGRAVAGLTSVEMRQLYGDGVCASTSGLKPGSACTLTPTADYFMQWLNESSAGGHCFGFAAAASLGFQGSLPALLPAGATAFSLTPTTAVQRTIQRLFVTQYTQDAPGLSPRQVVDLLRTRLTPGAAPLVLGIYQMGPDGSPAGGHAITPYALLDRGDGLFDIAVYDNNWPDMPRAVHVDYTNDQWAYLAATNPNEASEIYVGDASTQSMSLYEVNKANGRQPCPICSSGSGGGVLVGFDPLLAANQGVTISLLDENLKPLSPSKFQELPPLSPPTETQLPMPAFQVRSGVPFVVDINGAGALKKEKALNVYLLSGGTIKNAEIDTFGPGVRTFVGVDPRRGDFVAGSTNKSAPILIDTHETPGVSYYFASRKAVAATVLLSQNVNRKTRRVVIDDSSRKAGLVSFATMRQVGSVTTTYLARNVKMAAKDKLVLVYSAWKAKTGAPVLWLDKKGDGKLDVKVKLVISKSRAKADGGSRLVGSHWYPQL